MRNIRNVLSLLLVLLSLSACEKEIPLINELGTERITISAIVSPDTVVLAFITEATDFEYFSSISLRSDYYKYDEVIKRRRDILKDSTKVYESVLMNANAELVVNDGDVYPMKLDTTYLTYNSDYVPVQGDKIKIKVTSMSDSLKINGERIQFNQAEAVTTLPSCTPKIKISSTHLSYKEKETYEVVDIGMGDTTLISDYWGADTVMTIKMKILDPGNEKNYYRLLVRSVGASRVYSGSYSAAFMTYLCVDDFKSGDKLFYDSDLVKPYGFIPAYFSNVFDDELLNGREYEFTVETRMRKKSEITPYVIVELQHLSPDLYYHMKDIEVFRISEFDLYDNPIQINSNVSGGWGVFGAMTYDTHIVPFK